jgi:GntR family transcriptional regulator, galactonate operon transcriptional repressor
MTLILDGPNLDRPPTLCRFLSENLGRRIVSGELEPGSKIVPEQIQRSFGVSRAACRESMQVLSAKGLIISKPAVGTRVAPVERWSLLDSDVLSWAPADGWIADSARRLHAQCAGIAVAAIQGDPVAAHLMAVLSEFGQP